MLDLFHALDEHDLARIVEYLADDVSGAIRLPDRGVITFDSRAEYVVTVGAIIAELRGKGVRCTTRMYDYDVNTDATTTVASLDLRRRWVAGEVRLDLRGHATVVWRTSEEPAKVTHWRITWEEARVASGEWPPHDDERGRGRIR